MKKVTLLLVFLLSGMLLHASVTIGGLKYMLDKSSHTAIVDWGNCWEGELEIPEVVSYDGEDYTVNSFHWLAFQDCKSLTKVTIPL